MTTNLSSASKTLRKALRLLPGEASWIKKKEGRKRKVWNSSTTLSTYTSQFVKTFTLSREKSEKWLTEKLLSFASPKETSKYEEWCALSPFIRGISVDCPRQFYQFLSEKASKNHFLSSVRRSQWQWVDVTWLELRRLAPERHLPTCYPWSDTYEISGLFKKTKVWFPW